MVDVGTPRSDGGTFQPTLQVLGENGHSRSELLEAATVAAEGFFVTCYDAASRPPPGRDELAFLRGRVYDDFALRYAPGPGCRGVLLLAKASADGAVIGCIGIEAMALRDLPLSPDVLKSLVDSAESPAAVYMSNLSVLASLRGQGVGRWLVRQAEAKARSMMRARKARGAARVMLLVNEGNTPARRLYESLGYVEALRDPWASRCVSGRDGHVQRMRATNIGYTQVLGCPP